jgi:hypothetical protein
MASGKRCGSPALRGKTTCYYHLNLAYRLPSGRQMFFEGKKNPAPGEWPVYEFPVPILEDAAAIQIGFMQALHGVCNDNLPPRKAKLVLSALHGASANLNRLHECLAAARNVLEKKSPAGAKQGRRRRAVQKSPVAGNNTRNS